VIAGGAGKPDPAPAKGKSSVSQDMDALLSEITTKK